LLTKPIRISVRASGWPREEIEAIHDARIRGAGDEEIRALVKTLEAARSAPKDVTVLDANSGSSTPSRTA
jgi:hypothetical protein